MIQAFLPMLRLQVRRLSWKSVPAKPQSPETGSEASVRDAWRGTIGVFGCFWLRPLSVEQRADVDLQPN